MAPPFFTINDEIAKQCGIEPDQFCHPSGKPRDCRPMRWYLSSLNILANAFAGLTVTNCSVTKESTFHDPSSNDSLCKRWYCVPVQHLLPEIPSQYAWRYVHCRHLDMGQSQVASRKWRIGCTEPKKPRLCGRLLL